MSLVFKVVSVISVCSFLISLTGCGGESGEVIESPAQEVASRVRSGISFKTGVSDSGTEVTFRVSIISDNGTLLQIDSSGDEVRKVDLEPDAYTVRISVLDSSGGETQLLEDCESPTQASITVEEGGFIDLGVIDVDCSASLVEGDTGIVASIAQLAPSTIQNFESDQFGLPPEWQAGNCQVQRICAEVGNWTVDVNLDLDHATDWSTSDSVVEILSSTFSLLNDSNGEQVITGVPPTRQYQTCAIVAMEEGQTLLQYDLQDGELVERSSGNVDIDLNASLELFGLSPQPAELDLFSVTETYDASFNCASGLSAVVNAEESAQEIILGGFNRVVVDITGLPVTTPVSPLDSASINNAENAEDIMTWAAQSDKLSLFANVGQIVSGRFISTETPISWDSGGHIDDISFNADTGQYVSRIDENMCVAWNSFDPDGGSAMLVADVLLETAMIGATREVVSVLGSNPASRQVLGLPISNAGRMCITDAKLQSGLVDLPLDTFSANSGETVDVVVTVDLNTAPGEYRTSPVRLLVAVVDGESASFEALASNFRNVTTLSHNVVTDPDADGVFTVSVPVTFTQPADNNVYLLTELEVIDDPDVSPLKVCQAAKLDICSSLASAKCGPSSNSCPSL